MAEINITPFTDVLLVLLIIFMILAALVTPPGFQKAFDPCSTCSSHPRRPLDQKIELSISANGTIFVGSTRVNVRTIYGVLAQLARPKSKMAIIADAKAPYGLVLRALDAAKEAGIADVSFVSQ